MEISPIIVSMKTASVSIVITFFWTGSRIWRGAYPQQKAAAGL